VALVNFKNEVLVRVYVVTLLVLMVALVIIFKAGKLSLKEGDFWRKEAAKKTMAYRDVLGERGNILSEDGSLLATDIPYFDVYWDAAVAKKRLKEDEIRLGLDSLSMYLAYYIAPQSTPGDWKDFLWQELNRGSHYSLIAKDLTYDKVQLLKTFPIFRNGKYNAGLIVNRINKRSHPFRMLALRTLGYVKEAETAGEKDIAVGLEGRFDKTLSGGTEKVLMQRVGSDMWSPVNDLSDIEPRNGEDIVTTLDINIQDITQAALMRSVTAFQAQHGTAIVMEVKTGKIKAVANLGLTKEGYWEDYNYGIGMPIEPGSTFKLASMMSLLEDGLVKLSDTVDIMNGRRAYFDAVMEDHERTNKTLVTVKEAFAASSNVGVSGLLYDNYQAKPAAFIKHLKDFYLTVPTGVEIEGEGAPYFKDPNNPADAWSGITVPWMSIGYELKVTPLQLLAFYNAVANDGTLMKPYMVNSIQQFGDIKKTFKPLVVKNKIATKATLEQARELLEAVVEMPGGTAYKWRTSQYRFAGKTGTAQLNYGKNKGKDHTGGYQGSFVGYFPAENPIYSCIVVISKPKSGFYGGIVAAPVFREIADKLMASNIALSEPINVKGKPVASAATLPDDVGFKDDLVKALTAFKMKYEILNKDEDWTSLKAKGDTINITPRNLLTKKSIPSVVGMGLKDALYILENRGLKVQFSGYGKVVAQSLNPGGPAQGQVISIKLE
jgi:cell division protein FtsI (penicillin-binding protein 3)